MNDLNQKPLEVTFMRHGLSEANIIQKAEKSGSPHELTEKVYERHDFEQRLSLEGVEQALMARRWLISEHMAPEDYDERYMSPFFRTMETAITVGGDSPWLPNLSLIERDWGLFGATPLQEREIQYADIMKMKELSSFFTRFTGGESVFDTTFRVRAFIDTLYRENGGQRILAVTHGELMWAARNVIERLLPTEWQAMDDDKTKRIGNCCLLQYARTNPDNLEDISTSLSNGWRRMYDPVEPEKSPYGGEWHKLPGKQRLGPDQVMKIIEQKPRLIPPIFEIAASADCS